MTEKSSIHGYWNFEPTHCPLKILAALFLIDLYCQRVIDVRGLPKFFTCKTLAQYTFTPDEQVAAKELVETINNSDLSAEEKQEQVYEILNRG